MHMYLTHSPHCFSSDIYHQLDWLNCLRKGPAISLHAIISNIPQKDPTGIRLQAEQYLMSFLHFQYNGQSFPHMLVSFMGSLQTALSSHLFPTLLMWQKNFRGISWLIREELLLLVLSVQSSPTWCFPELLQVLINVAIAWKNLNCSSVHEGDTRLW